ncbi:hypothetical protein [Methanocella arvoryzae]|nr:hypothetical protein [Methanocella arvoryzae]
MPSIAIIDSDPNMARICETAFASRGHTLAFHAANCAEALEKLRASTKTPDMIVVSSDHGSEALKTIKSEHPSIIVKEVRGKNTK